SHLFLKALFLAPRESGIRPMVAKFWSTYQTVRPSSDLEPRVSRLLLMLLLARVDGKSPVEYLDSARRDFVREFVQSELPARNLSLAVITNAWFTRLSPFKN